MKKLIFVLVFLVAAFQVCNAQMWVTGYYPNYANYPRPGQLQWNIWTHIVHFCVYPDQAFNPDPTHPEQVHYRFDNGRGNFENATSNQNYPVQRQLIDTAHAHGRKVLLGYFSHSGTTGGTFQALYAMSPDTLKKFISSTLAYAKARGYDGVDIDWEWPGDIAGGNCWNFLVKTLRDTLNTWNPPGILTAAMFQWVSQLSSNLDWNLMNSAVDQINIMCYDMEYAGRNVIHAPLFPSDCNLLNPGIGYGTRGDNVKELINQYVLKGALKSKLGVGLPFYGYKHDGASAFCVPSGGGSQYQYFNIWTLYQSPNQSRYIFDTPTQTPYLSYTDASGGHFISFDDSSAITAKTSWGKSYGVGGFFVWEMSQDKYISNKGILTTAIGKGLGGTLPDTIKPPPIDTVKPPACDTVGSYNRGRISGYADGYVAGRASIVCPVCPPPVICPAPVNADSIARFWWNAALDAVSDSVKTPDYLKVIKPPKK